MVKQIFINLPVKDLKKTVVFFKELGFEFNPQFTDENAACMMISKDIFSMLIVEKMFKSFTKKKISDAKKSTEAIIGLAVNSKKEVDGMVDKAIRAGGNEPRKSLDHGWMYSRSFEDLDRHIWEIFYMDEKKMPKEMKDKK